MKIIKKEKSHAFGKDVYLLGRDKNGHKVWLEAANWDCGWYWGFGYIERYQQNWHPSKARDISSHTHWDSEIIGKHEFYDSEKQCFRMSNNYIHHFNANPNFIESVLTDSESWKLADLMQSFYTLKAAAEFYHQGNSHISSPELSLKNDEAYKRINEIELPAIFAEIYKILTPEA